MLYGRKTYQDAAIDSAKPSALARQRAQVLIDAYKEGDLETFCRGLRGTKGELFGNTPLIAEILRDAGSFEVDRITKSLKIKRRAKGAADERSDLARSLAKIINSRVQEWGDDGKTSGSLVGVDDLRILALRRPGGGPVADFFTNRIAASDSLSAVGDHRVLSLLLSEDASPEAREAFETSLRRTAANVFARADSAMNRYTASASRYSSHVGYLRHSSKSLLLHIRDNDNYRTLCGKYNVRSANYGSWNDAEVSDRYRQCKECLKAASPEDRSRAEAERCDVLPVKGNTEDEMDRIINSRKVRRVLERAARDAESYDELVYTVNWRTEPAAELRVAMLGEMGGIMKDRQDRLVEAEKNDSAAWSATWERVGMKHAEDLRERGYRTGYRWRRNHDLESHDWKNVFDQETRHRIMDKELERASLRARGEYDKAEEISDQVTRLVNKTVTRFISSTEPEAKPAG